MDKESGSVSGLFPDPVDPKRLDLTGSGSATLLFTPYVYLNLHIVSTFIHIVYTLKTFCKMCKKQCSRSGYGSGLFGSPGSGKKPDKDPVSTKRPL